MSEEPEIEDIKPPSKLKAIGFGLAIVVAIVLVLGFVGQISGTGWFGYRSYLYGQGELYVLNKGMEPLWVSVDGRERVEVKALNAQVVEIVGGESAVEVTDKSGDVKGRYTVDARNSHAFLKLTDDDCLAVTRLDPFYKGGGNQDIVIEAKLEAKTRVWIPNSKNVVWPRKPFPKRLSAGEGPGLWVELVGCELLNDDKFLDAYLALRLEERVKKAMGEGKKGK